MKTAHARMARIVGVITLVSGLSLQVATQYGGGAPLTPSAPLPCALFSAADLKDQRRGIELTFSRIQGIDVGFRSRYHVGGFRGMGFWTGGEFSMKIGGQTVRSGCQGNLIILLSKSDNPLQASALQTCAMLVSTSGANPVSFKFPEATLSDLDPAPAGLGFRYSMDREAGPDLQCSR